MTKIAAVSCPYSADDKQWNIDKMVEWVEKAAAEGVELVVFPEEQVGGLGTHGMQEFFPPDKLHSCEAAELIPEGPTTQFMAELAKKHDIYIAYGAQETDPDRWSITHNCRVLVGPEGYIGKHRKVHLPLSERMFHVPGTDYEVFDTRIGKVGLVVCYDMCFPETCRVLAIKGADIIVCPTGWPNMTQSLDDPDHHVLMTLPAARALENMVFFVQAVTCNHPDGPNIFEGHSQIIGPNPGQVLARTGFEEGMAVADVDIRAEIQKARIFSMGGDDLVRDRRPGTYGPIVAVNPYANFADGFWELDELQ